MNHSQTGRKSGFSLIELIVVISLIVLISAFVVPALPSILRGSQLTQTSQLISGQLSYARQQALARNRPVEVRFIRFADPELPGQDVNKPETGSYRAFQLLDVLENGVSVPLGKIQQFPDSILIDSNMFSTLVRTEDSDTTAGSTPLPIMDASKDTQAPEMPRGVKRNYQYISFRFLPDGSTNLSPAGSWYLTLLQTNDVAKIRSKDDIAKVNFYTLQVDPVSGSTRSFRPSAG